MKFKGERLRSLRNERGWTLTDLEVMTGKKKQYWSGIENGSRCNLRPKTVAEICTLFGVDENYFYYDDARLANEIIPDMPDEVKKFLADKKNTPYLVILEKAAREGITPAKMQKIIDVLLSEK